MSGILNQSLELRGEDFSSVFEAYLKELPSRNGESRARFEGAFFIYSILSNTTYSGTFQMPEFCPRSFSKFGVENFYQMPGEEFRFFPLKFRIPQFNDSISSEVLEQFLTMRDRNDCVILNKLDWRPTFRDGLAAMYRINGKPLEVFSATQVCNLGAGHVSSLEFDPADFVK